MNFYSNFNYEEINNFFSNLSSQSILELLELIKNYKIINYSTIEIEYHIQKIIAYPFLIMIITLLSSIIMLNIKHQRPKFFTIEHNFTENESKIDDLLITNGYVRIFRKLTSFDAWYIQKEDL